MLNDCCKVSKRTILAQIASIFDPLGLVGHIAVIILKLLLLWQLKIDWDESVPQDIHTDFTRYLEELRRIPLSIPRYVLQAVGLKYKLHGFSDASEMAYGACLYVKSIRADGTPFARLLCAELIVAPL